MEKLVTRMLIPVYQLGGRHTEHTSSPCAVCVQTGIAIMTGNGVFALPLGLMGMHKSAWSLCSQGYAELGDAHQGHCWDSSSTNVLQFPLVNTLYEFNYIKVVDIMAHYI